jgi:CelD/BcsL family acetyltransferase involved in cellulose biosynthesis
MKLDWTFVPARKLGAQQAAWDELNAAGPATPLLSAAFVRPLLEHFGDARELLLAFCPGPHAPQAMAILHRTAIGQWETFQPSQAPLGAWLEHSAVPTENLLGGLARALPGLAMAVGITQQDPELLPRPKDGKHLTTLDFVQTARVSVQGTFDEYWNRRGKNLKHNMKRQRARLEKDGVKASLDIVTSPAEVEQAIAEYGALESSSWKAQGGTAVHPQNAQGRFYCALLKDFCGKGRGRIHRYRFNDKVVAMDLCIEGNGTLVVLKTAHDESIKTISPAFLMRQEAFRILFDEQRIERIEFYGKLMDWHTKWSEEVRTMYHVTYYRWDALRGMSLLLRRGRQPSVASVQQPA